MSSSVQIASATPADAGAIVPLFKAYQRFYGRDCDEARTQEFLETRITRKESAVFVARSEREIVGFMQLYPVFSSLALSRAWLLNDLFVAPAKRGFGYGKQLVAHATAFARETGAVSIFLQTARDNAPAQRLYESEGYVRDERFYRYDLRIASDGRAQTEAGLLSGACIDSTNIAR